MPLLDAIIDANQLAGSGGTVIRSDLTPFQDSLPLVVLTCIDPRLNPILPRALGVPEEKFIWMRNAGNIITSPLSSTMRSMALACAVKGGKEIAVIGHTDCQVRKTTVMELIERFRALGIERSQLPDNLIEFFSLFASEQQNVMKAVDFIRQSPLIGPKVPVHGLLLDIQNGRLSWVVNGYQTLGGPRTVLTPPAATPGSLGMFQNAFETLGSTEIKTQDRAVGGDVARVETAAPQPVVTPIESSEASRVVAPQASFRLSKNRRYKVIGSDQKIYGPIPGDAVMKWVAEGRIDGHTPAQIEGRTEWKPLSAYAEPAGHPDVHLPPRI